MNLTPNFTILQQQKITQSQIQSLHLLMMDNVELTDFLQEEYKDNPLLEHHLSNTFTFSKMSTTLNDPDSYIPEIRAKDPDFFMNFLGSAVFSATVSFFYTRQKSLKRALLGLICSIVAMTAVMIAFNLIVTPVYLGQPRQAIIDMILPLLLPFNLGKGILNAALTMLLYKPISIALGHTSFSQHVSSAAPKKKNSYIVAGCSILLIAAVLLYFFIKMGATV